MGPIFHSDDFTGSSKPPSENLEQSSGKDTVENAFRNVFVGMEQLRSNTENLGNTLKHMLSGEVDNTINHSCQDDFASKALKLSTHTLEECSKGQANVLAQLRSTFRHYFSRKRSQAIDRTLLQNQLVPSERPLACGLDDDYLGDVPFGLQSIESNGLHWVVGVRSTDESINEEIEIVYMPQHGSAFACISEELDKEESFEIISRVSNTHRNFNENKDSDSREIIVDNEESTNATYSEELMYEFEEGAENREDDTDRHAIALKRIGVHLDSETRELDPIDS